MGTDAARSGAPTEAQALERFQARHAVLRCGGGRGNELALTFDDGPTALTRCLLGVLEAHGAKATFFVIGREIATHRRAVALAADARDEIGNHTWSHPTLTTLARGRIDRQLAATSQAITAASGQMPRLVRPPGGRRSPEVDDSIRAHGLIETLWSVDPRDWASRDPRAIARAVLAAAVPGAIVVLHGGRPATLAALPAILDGLRSRGLRSVTIPRLLADDPPTRSACAPPLAERTARRV